MRENLYLQFMIFALVFVGFLVRRTGVVSEQGQKGMTGLVTNVILPCNIVKAFLSSSLQEALAEGLNVLLIGTGIQVFSVIYGRLVFSRWKGAENRCLRYATICSNAGFLGNPIAEGLYGAEGLLLANIYLLPQRIMMWSSGLAIFTGSHDRKKTFVKVVTHPCIIACALGTLLMVTGWSLPELLLRPVSSIGSCNTAMSMMVVGMIVARIDPRHFLDRTVVIFTIHRLLVIPGLVYGVCSLLPVSATVRGLCVILAAMPAGATTSILADRYDQDPAFASRLVIFSTLMSIPTIALWSMILL